MKLLKIACLVLLAPLVVAVFILAIWIGAAVGIVEMILTENENARFAERFRVAIAAK